MFKSTVWAFLGVLSTQLSTFVISVILARILAPEEFGQIALLLVIVAFCDIFINGGFTVALIQKKDAGTEDFSTVAMFSLIVALFFYILLFFCSNEIAHFFDIENFSRKIRYLGIIIFPKVLFSLQSAYCRKNLKFQKLYFFTVLTNLIGGGIAIILAKRGYGVYALINQQLITSFSASILLSIFSGLHLRLFFSWELFKRIYSFSWKIFSIDFLTFCFQNIRSVIVGKMYPLDVLGYFNKGSTYATFATGTISTTLSSVMLPFLSKEQDSPQNSKKVIRRSIQLTVLIIYPLIFGLIACANNLVLILLTDKWVKAVIFLQIFASFGLWAKPQVICLEAIKAKGLGSVYLRIEIIRKILEFCILIPSVFIGIKALALSSSLACFLAWFPIAFVARKKLNYSYKEQIDDCLPAFLSSLLMGIVAYCFNFIHFNPYVIIVLQVGTGLLLYTVFVFMFDVPGKDYILDKLNSLFLKLQEKI